MEVQNITSQPRYPLVSPCPVFKPLSLSNTKTSKRQNGPIALHTNTPKALYPHTHTHNIHTRPRGAAEAAPKRMERKGSREGINKVQASSDPLCPPQKPKPGCRDGGHPNPGVWDQWQGHMGSRIGPPRGWEQTAPTAVELPGRTQHHGMLHPMSQGHDHPRIPRPTVTIIPEPICPGLSPGPGGGKGHKWGRYGLGRGGGNPSGCLEN